MTNPEALAACRVCGSPVSVQVFKGKYIHGGATVWMCSSHPLLGGACKNDDAYLTEDAWNTRASSDVANIVAWLRGEADEHAKDEAHNEADTVRNIASCIERGDWK